MENWALPEISHVLCDRCGLCVERCPTQAVVMTSQGPSITRPADCTYCAQCDAVCPRGAIACSFELVWEEKA